MLADRDSCLMGTLSCQDDSLRNDTYLKPLVTVKLFIVSIKAFIKLV